MMRMKVLALAATLISSQALAWGPDGHQMIGAIADKLLQGSLAEKEVKAILGGLSLQQAAVWADCAKGVSPGKDYAYTSAGRYPECAIYETPAREAEMSDFVRRNDNNCGRKPSEESCHKQYHYSDVAIQRDRYQAGKVGTRDDDLVAAVVAATHVLKGEPAPAPFKLKDKREALLLLTHYLGDIHQPLHVGAIYLNAKGSRVDPDAKSYDAATDNLGGNRLITVNATSKKDGPNMHQTWDAIPVSMNVDHLDAAWLVQARAIPQSSGTLYTWPVAWASETLGQTQLAMKNLRFGRKVGNEWRVTLPASYRPMMADIKEEQLTRAGARLAQVLENVWP
jgi:hypothetical protein